MKIVTLVCRILLGLGFLIFGLNGFFNFIPVPPDLPPLMQQFNDVMMIHSHYFQFIAAFEVVGAVLLLTNQFVPLALTLLGPVLVNILIFHIAIDLKDIGPGIVFTALWFVVFWSVRLAFAGIFSQRVAS